MNFNTYSYILFLFVLFFIYFDFNIKNRKKLLLFACFIFYISPGPFNLLVLLASCGLNFFTAKLIFENKHNNKLLLSLNIILNLTLLSYFKYFLAAPIDAFKLVIPIGISFYTFQAMAYTIDVYRKKIPPEENIFDFILFISFFPQLIAGPIERAGNLIPQLKQLKSPSRIQVKEGIGLLIIGLFYKIVISDNCGKVANVYLDFQDINLNTFQVSLGLLAFSFKIYADFYGYCKIAKGTAKLLSINLSRNFDAPYLTTNIKEFWRRWHITLSYWLRDYLYIPLGGNRKGPIRKNINLLITMSLCGIWHGSTLNFLAWGIYNGILLVLYDSLNKIVTIKLPKIFSWLINFIFILYGWMIFYTSSYKGLLQLNRSLFSSFIFATLKIKETFSINLFWTLVFGSILFTFDFIERNNKKEEILNFNSFQHYLIAVLLITLIFLVPGSSERFIYYQF
jgi:alginate O-acetyltransferase complex protein AlgI